MRAQYIEFLADTLPAGEYAALLPALDDLVLGFGVDPEVAFKARLSRHNGFRHPQPWGATQA